MSQIDLDRIVKSSKYFSEACEIVTECYVIISHPLGEDEDLKFKVRVVRDSNGSYVGIPSHRIGDYVSLHSQDSVQLAVEDALSGIRAWYNPERPMKEQFTEFEDY